jgi:hypothetical protein
MHVYKAFIRQLIRFLRPRRRIITPNTISNLQSYNILPGIGHYFLAIFVRDSCDMVLVLRAKLQVKDMIYEE